jgi:hypothetical protein
MAAGSKQQIKTTTRRTPPPMQSNRSGSTTKQRNPSYPVLVLKTHTGEGRRHKGAKAQRERVKFEIKSLKFKIIIHGMR